MFFTYVDWTITTPQPFYVGVGDIRRLGRRFGRNKHHTHTAKKYGLDRRTVASFETREDALAFEIKLIAEYHTFVDDPNYNGIGTNYTIGGEGCTCSKETKQKIRNKIRAQYAAGRKPWNFGKKYQQQNISAKERIRRGEQLVAYNKALPHLGRHRSQETRNRMKKPHMCSICKMQGHTKTRCHNRPANAINNVQIAQQRRRLKMIQN